MNEQIQRHLKRLALSERWDDLRVLLEEYVTENPNDAEANNELRRLNNGEPLRLMLSATEKKQAIANDSAKTLSWLMDDHPLEELRHCNIEELRHIYSTFEKNERSIRIAKRQLSDNELLYKHTVKNRIKELLYSDRFVIILGLIIVPLFSFVLITVSEESPLYTSISRIAWVHGKWFATFMWALTVMVAVMWITPYLPTGHVQTGRVLHYIGRPV